MKIKRIILIMTIFFSGITTYAIAAPQLSLSPASILQGGTGTMNLTLSGGTEPYAGVNAKIFLPQGITVTGVSKGSLLSSAFKTAWKVLPEAGGTRITLAAYSGFETFNSSAGTLLTLHLQAPGYMQTGSFPLTFAQTNQNPKINSRYALSNADGSLSITPAVSSGNITVQAGADTDNDGLPDWWEQQIIDANSADSIQSIYNVQPGSDFENDGYTNLTEFKYGINPTVSDNFLKGDVNDDHMITPQDAVDAFNLSLESQWASEELDRADFNGDERITPQDAVDIFNISF
ncbi:MAG: dockerin type I domain-containing protein [Desulfococcaceae bacterium]|jgi:hypothetical protein|nr:dockerin type I domain-containing protein [Desulfococcaceae bacterium]